MAGFIERVIGSNSPLLAIGLVDLEKHVGNSGVDTRLIADMLHEGHKVMRKLRLDTKDTTPKELYHALLASVKSGQAEELLLDADFVLLPIDGEVVSFNLIDVVENYHHHLSFEKRSTLHGVRALRGVIVERYLNSGKGDRVVIETTARNAGLLIEEEHISPVATVKEMLRPSKNEGPYLLAIGDTVTDAFIQLKEDRAEIMTDDKGIKHLCMEFGAKPPYDHVDVINAVGNSANAAVAFSRLGLRSGLMSFLGNDQAGKDSLAYLESEGVDTTPIAVEEGKKTNYHYVLRYGADRTILIKYEDYSYKWRDPEVKPTWVYLSMISKDAWRLHEDLLEYLEKNSDVRLAFQPGTFHFEWGREKLKKIYERSHVVMMNKEEAALVTDQPIDDVRNLMSRLHELGPEVVVVTDGPNGAYASDGNKMYKMINYPDPAPPYDRTGAGDAFASTIVAALAMGEDITTALKWAPINSMSVVQKLGAQAGLLDKKHIEEWLKKAPKNYVLEELD